MQADVERRQPKEPGVQNFRGDKVVAASAGDTAVQLKVPWPLPQSPSPVLPSLSCA